MVALYNPRVSPWNKDFAWSADALSIIGKTPAGRATVTVLDLNRLRNQRIRAADMAVGRHPPEGDERLIDDEALGI